MNHPDERLLLHRDLSIQMATTIVVSADADVAPGLAAGLGSAAPARPQLGVVPTEPRVQPARGTAPGDHRLMKTRSSYLIISLIALPYIYGILSLMIK